MQFKKCFWFEVGSSFVSIKKWHRSVAEIRTQLCESKLHWQGENVITMHWIISRLNEQTIQWAIQLEGGNEWNEHEIATREKCVAL